MVRKGWKRLGAWGGGRTVFLVFGYCFLFMMLFFDSGFLVAVGGS